MQATMTILVLVAITSMNWIRITRVQLQSYSEENGARPSHAISDNDQSSVQNIQTDKRASLRQDLERYKHMISQTQRELFQKDPSENTSMTTAPPTQNRFVMLTSVNAEYIEIAENWLESLRRLSLRFNLTVVAEDDGAFRHFSNCSTDEFRVLSGSKFAVNFKWSYPKGMTFEEVIRRRTVYIRTLLEHEHDVLLVDVDAVWVKNPIDIILNEYDDYDLWYAQGSEGIMPCPCFMYMKAVPRVIAMVRKWVERLETQSAVKHESDQEALTMVLPLFSDISTKKLDFERFPSGLHYFNRGWLALHRDEVYVAHGNHHGRHDEKKRIFKEFGLWMLKS